MDSDKKKILIVDDDKFLLNMYAKKMDTAGFTIETAENGNQALEKIKAGFAADVLVVDIIMPGMNGLEFVKALHKGEFLPKAKIIMLTNQSESPDIKAAKELGVDGYIIKATTIPSEVVAKVREILGGKQVFSAGF